MNTMKYFNLAPNIAFMVRLFITGILIFIIQACVPEKEPEVVNNKFNCFDTYLPPSLCFAEDTSADVNGYTTVYYDNGNIKKEGNYNNGVPSGNWKYYYRDGHIKKEGNFNEGEVSGNWKFWHPNGLLGAEGNFAGSCRPSGYFKTYHFNGVIRSEGNYVSGSPSGYWKFYNDSGELVFEGNLNCR